MSKEEQYYQERVQWLAKRRAAGQHPYPNDFQRKDLIADLCSACSDMERDALEAKAQPACIAGRIVGKRAMGGTGFANLRDMSGDIQLMFGKQFSDADTFSLYDADLDVGDIVGIVGAVTKTLKGELTVRVKKMDILVKALRPIPKEFYGIKDVEQRYRKRYLDLITNAESREVFRYRANTISAIRQFLDNRGFLEVETPMMQTLPGGATARPFVTHHNALDMDLYLRVAPELFLKRLVVGGMEQVYEINRNFRNEGVSRKHNPEFTMVEFYQAYARYQDLMDMTEEMLRSVCERVTGAQQFEYQGQACDFSKPFHRLTMSEALLHHNQDLNDATLQDFDKLKAYAHTHQVSCDAINDLGKLQAALFEKTVEPQLMEPTFITAFPLAISPLARCSENAPDQVDRFELFIAGMEMANGFSELNDPADQKQRLLQQAQEKVAGDDEAMYYDGDYIEALEWGLPPTAGEGIGIDRLVMLLTDSASIRDVILFPHMRPKSD